MSTESTSPSSTAKLIRGEGSDNNGNISKIQVVDPQQLGSGVNSYVTYKVNTETDRKQYEQARFQVIKRYSDFDWLRHHLIRTYPGVIVPPLPEKSVLKKTESSFVEMRRRGKYTKRRSVHRVMESTIVDISIPPPSFKPVSLSLSQSSLSKTPKQVFF